MNDSEHRYHSVIALVSIWIVVGRPKGSTHMNKQTSLAPKWQISYFGLISRTAAIIDTTTPKVRSKTQGTVDVLAALTGASGGAMSGIVLAGDGYSVLSLAGGLMSLLLFPVVA